VNGEFHSHLQHLGIRNWEFDYGKGLVITQAIGAKLSIPVELFESGEYEIFLRYMKNPKGGPVKVYFDNELIREITSEDSNSNFVWENIGSSLNFTKGKHTIMLENVAGFNAINILAVLPTKETKKLVDNAYSIANKTRNIYLFEAESDFYNGKGRHNHPSSVYRLFEHEESDNFNRISRGQFRIPTNADLMSLQFISNNDSLTNRSDSFSSKNSYYSIGNLQIYPAKEKNNVFSLDFEREQVSIPLAALRQTFVNYDKNVLSTSLESRPDRALRVIVEQGNSSNWKRISTDFIPVNDKKYYNFSLDLSAEDVKQLNTRVLYYDSDKKEIKSDLTSSERDGTFNDRLTASIVPPLESKYVKVEVLVLPNAARTSSYLLDNLKFEEIIPQKPLLSNDLPRFQSKVNTTPQFAQNAENGYTIPNDASGLKVPFNLAQTRPIPVKENTVYNYTLQAMGENLDYLAVLASFRSSQDVVENSTKYGVNASNGNVLSLSPGSEIYTYLDVLKASNYTIALRASTCDDRCSSNSLLGVSIAQENLGSNTNNIIDTSNISLEDLDNVEGSISGNNGDKTQLKWIYLNNTYLEEGRYKIKIHSDSQVDLDSVIVYSTAYDHTKAGRGGQATKQYEALEDLFNPSDSNEPAFIEDYKKIDPTKYEVKIRNATRPYVISLAETYDPLWVAHFDPSLDNTSVDEDNNRFEKRSIPLFSVVNGFYINKTGNYTLTIEYEQQKWLFEGGIISACTATAIVTLFVLSSRKKVIPYYNRKNRNI
jgi:hypothetical protein